MYISAPSVVRLGGRSRVRWVMPVTSTVPEFVQFTPKLPNELGPLGKFPPSDTETSNPVSVAFATPRMPVNASAVATSSANLVVILAESTGRPRPLLLLYLHCGQCAG